MKTVLSIGALGVLFLFSTTSFSNIGFAAGFCERRFIWRSFALISQSLQSMQLGRSFDEFLG